MSHLSVYPFSSCPCMSHLSVYPFSSCPCMSHLSVYPFSSCPCMSHLSVYPFSSCPCMSHLSVYPFSMSLILSLALPWSLVSISLAQSPKLCICLSTFFSIFLSLSLSALSGSCWRSWFSTPPSILYCCLFSVYPRQLWGFAKLKTFQKSTKKLDRAQPTHPPPIQIFFFLETHGQNTQITTFNNVQTEYITLRSYHMSTHSPHWK